MTVAELEPRGLELLAALERLGASTEISLDLPPEMPYEQYAAVGVALARGYRGMIWMIADWINFGEKTYGEKYAQAVEETGLHPETLRNYASVARRVPAERRVAGVPFGVHEAVAALEPREQTEWLERVVKNDWKREDLRQHLRGNVTPALPPPVDLADLARHLCASAVEMGDGYLVHREAFVRLEAAVTRGVM